MLTNEGAVDSQRTDAEQNEKENSEGTKPLYFLHGISYAIIFC